MTAGTTPPGAAGEQQAARWVRDMFAAVAGRYDLLNHLLSFNADRYWRWRTVRKLRPILERADARVLDVCCGTGDLLLALQNGRERAVFGSDFCHPMLIEARRKITRRRLPSGLVEGDALCLPLADRSMDLVAVAFGFRNLANYWKGLLEFRRVLKSSGTLAILEFSQPTNRLFAALYQVYSRRLLPVVGGLISGSRRAYSYLPDSVRKFPSPSQLCEEMARAGFRQVSFERMTGGIVTLHLATGGN